MSFPCNIPCIVCPPSIGGGIGPVDPANPFVNLSAEDPDHDDFIGRRYRPPEYPPLGSTWYAIGCIGWCLSEISQEDADLCAANQTVLCQPTLWPQPCGTCQPTPDDPFPLEPRPVFFSNSQVCAFACPDGTFFNFVTAPGLFNSTANQATADIMAYTYACNKAVANHMCLGNLSPSRTCAGSLYNGSISASTSNTPVTFELVTPLPDGLLLSQNETTAFIQGTQSVPGDYVFTLKATDSLGNSIEKVVNISFFGVFNESPLPDAEVGTPYSVILLSEGTPAGPVVFSITDGDLPDGLSFNNVTGEIFGTPTTEETQSLTVTVTDGVLTCSKQMVIEVTGVGCVDWPAVLMWGTANTFTQDGGTASFTPSNVLSDTASCSTSVTGIFNSQASCDNFGQFVYNGPACNCKVTVTLTNSNPAGGQADDAFVSVQGINAGLIFQQNFGTSPTGVYVVNFTLPDTLGIPDTIFAALNQAQGFPDGPRLIVMSATFDTA